MQKNFVRCTSWTRDIKLLALHTVRGPIQFTAEPDSARHKISITVPASYESELVLILTAQPSLKCLSLDQTQGLNRYRLVSGSHNIFTIPKPKGMSRIPITKDDPYALGNRERGYKSRTTKSLITKGGFRFSIPANIM